MSLRMDRYIPVVSVFCASLLWSAPAHAYLDPGTGSMFLQLLLGGLAGAAVVGRMYWSRFKGFFRGTINQKNRTDHERG